MTLASHQVPDRHTGSDADESLPQGQDRPSRSDKFPERLSSKYCQGPRPLHVVALPFSAWSTMFTGLI